jgi:hypothetical protein
MATIVPVELLLVAQLALLRKLQGLGQQNSNHMRVLSVISNPADDS